VTLDPVLLLHQLLDRHERNAGANTPTARIDESRFRSVADWDEFLSVLTAIERKGGVHLVRIRREGTDHIRTVRLADPAIVYDTLGRIPSAQSAAAAIAPVTQVEDGKNIADLIARIEAGWARHKTLFGLKPGQSERLDKAVRLTRALRRKAHVNDLRQIDFRTFSRAAVGDSKALADTLQAVAALLQSTDPERLAGLTPEAVITLHGVERLPSPVLLAGSVALDGVSLPCAEYLGFPGEVAERLSLTDPPAYLLTIENFTSFIRHARERVPIDGGLALYTGGFPSRAVLAVLMRLAAQSPAPLYHWGDIDLGGLRIFRTIEQALVTQGHTLRPHLMSFDLLLDQGQPDPRRKKPLAGAAQGSAIAPLWDAMAHMKTLNELEQEGLAPTSPHILAG